MIRKWLKRPGSLGLLGNLAVTSHLSLPICEMGMVTSTRIIIQDDNLENILACDSCYKYTSLPCGK